MASQVVFSRPAAAAPAVTAFALWAAAGSMSVAAAAWALWQPERTAPASLATASGIMLLVMGGWQLRVAAGKARRDQPVRFGSGQTRIAGGGYRPRHRTAMQTARLAGAVMSCLVASYAVCLCVGNRPGVEWLFAACLSACSMAGLSQWSARRAADGEPRRAARPLVGRKAAACIAWLSVGLLLLEGGLRLTEGVTRTAWPFKTRQASAAAQRGDGLAMQEPPGAAGSELPRQLRVAVLSRSALAPDGMGDDCLPGLKEYLPGARVSLFGMPGERAGSGMRELASRVAESRPDVVVIVLGMGHDILCEAPPARPFDWRSVRLVRLAAVCLKADWVEPARGRTLDRPAERPADYESFLRSMSGDLVVCRTPIARNDERRWQASLDSLGTLIDHCRGRDLPVALVALPSQLQVNPLIREALRRRAGYEADQLDIELPQRRLARFADEQHVPFLDLLPHFRASDKAVYAAGWIELSDEGMELASETLGGWLRTLDRRA